MLQLDEFDVTEYVVMEEKSADSGKRDMDMQHKLCSLVEEAFLKRSVASSGRENIDPENELVFTTCGQDASIPMIVPWTTPERAAPGPSLHALQEWEGHVLEIRATDFVAHLVDLTAGASHAGEEAIIPRAELSDGNDARMREGSVFRWVIGYEVFPGGETKRRVSEIVFRDLPAVTKSDLADGETWAHDMARLLNP